MKLHNLLICLFAVFANAQKSPSIINLKDGSHGDGALIGLDLMGGNEKGITIYPNPNNDHILISVAGETSGLRHITIVNLSGQRVFSLRNRRENTFMVDVSDLKKGIYSIEVSSGRNLYRKKWAKR